MHITNSTAATYQGVHMIGLWLAWVCLEASYQVVLGVDCYASVSVVGMPQSV